MNFFESQQSRYKKALEFFNDPEISEGRKDLKRQEFNELKQFCDAQVYHSEILDLKFKVIGDYVIFESGAKIYLSNVDKMVNMSKQAAQRLYKVFTIFENSIIID